MIKGQVLKLICKSRHNGFIEGDVYEGKVVDNKLGTIRVISKINKNSIYLYSPVLRPYADFIGTWFWTLEEQREMKLNKILD
jgi:hypothetical protein